MPNKTKTRRPTVLVLEGLSDASNRVRRAGGVAREVNPRSLDAVDKALHEPWDALLLTGGGDVDPRLYGRKPAKHTYGVSETRDLTETLALEEARRRRVPVLGICRGAQLINVEAGGTLRQHIRGHRGMTHPVRAKGLLQRATGEDVFAATSLHHQCVGEIARGYVLVGYALDGTPEAIASRNGRVLGVQFHPEMDRAEYAAGIFRWLVVEAASRAGLRKPTRPQPKRRAPQPPARRFGEPRVATSRADLGRLLEESVQQLRDRPGEPEIPFAWASDLPKRRTAGQRRFADVKVSWICPTCAIRFDREDDRDDHVDVFHGPVGSGRAV